MNKYQCAVCKGVFEETFDDQWTKEDMEKEFEENFKIKIEEIDKQELTRVCDDCYNRIHPKLNPEKVLMTQQYLNKDKN